jgi:hypothetical protein
MIILPPDAKTETNDSDIFFALQAAGLAPVAAGHASLAMQA